MELKVWCDGIQRVVCGVNSQTTCQDVVFALAHATAQTGRFILIERFRNSERLLAPTEHTLQVLSKWGEYANDVTFVMKRSENLSKMNANLSLSPQSLSPSSSASSLQHMRALLRDKNQELESQKNELQSLTNSINQLDSLLSEKRAEVDRLLVEIKEANIEGLALQTANDKQRFSSNRGVQEFHRRTGSTRRIIGSPRELENAVATDKNPHGVWV